MANTPQATTVERGTIDRIPPQDIDAEMSLLGSLMLHRDAIGLVLPLLGRKNQNRFYEPKHQQLFEVLVDLYDQDKPIDLVVVKNELHRRNLLGRIGEESYLIDLVQSVGSWVNAEHYAGIVCDKSMLRDLIGCAGRIMNDAYSDAEGTREILDRAEQALFTVTEQRVNNQSVSLGEMLKEAYKLIESRGEHYISGLPTGYVEIDDTTSGLQPGEMIVIAARPSMGKTALGLNIAEHLAVDEKIPTAFFSMEMGRNQVAQRILCSRGRIDSHKLRRGLLNEDEIAQLGYVCQNLEDAPLFVDDTAGMTVLELKAKVRRLKMQHSIGCVFVDYLQLMYTPGAENRQQEVAFISRGLKALARELHIPVVVMAQLNRASEMREDNRPRLGNLRESGAIEQDADVVMLLHRPEYYKPDDVELKGVAEVIIAKQRNGPTGTIKLHFNKHFTRFDNLNTSPEAYVPAGSADATPF